MVGVAAQDIACWIGGGHTVLRLWDGRGPRLGIAPFGWEGSHGITPGAMVVVQGRRACWMGGPG
jgi:hypothetical protein